MKFRLSLLFLLPAQLSLSQMAFTRWNDIPVKDSLDNVWVNALAGGLNCPQFSQIDLNEDGKKDLFVFDRSTDKVLTFINAGNTGEVNYLFAPEYIEKFPVMTRWALLRDYNGDGKEDLFTCNDEKSGIRVFRNTSSTGSLSFSLAKDVLQADFGNFTTDIYHLGSDLPAILDVDGDHALDILLFEVGPFVGDAIYYFRNVSKEKYGHTDSLDYVRESRCWGRFREAPDNCTVFLNDTNGACKNGGFRPAPIAELNKSNKHSGSSILAFDANGDNLLDLLVGDISCSKTYLLTNDGTNTDAHMSSVTNDFPPSKPIDLPVFPAAYYLDVNNDGLNDLIVAPNIPNAADNFENCWLYLHTGTTTAPQFTFNTYSFLQNTMIDLGEGAYPHFFDYNADGKTDLLIGNYGYYNNTASYTSGIAVLENIGTSTQPEFKFTSTDYAELSLLNITAIAPTTGDMDNDGDDDLLIGDVNGTIHLLGNSAGPMAPANFTFSEANYKGIDVGQYACPQLVDVNRDGKLDLIIGEKDQNINYFQDTSNTNEPPAFKLLTDSLGKIKFEGSAFDYGFNSSLISDLDGDGNYELLSAQQNGLIYLYEHIEEDMPGTFTLSKIINPNMGKRISIAVANLDNDGKKDLAVGSYAGGISIFRQVEGMGVETDLATEDSFFSVYPNPASDLLTIKAKKNTAVNNIKVELINTLGIKVYETVVDDAMALQINIQNLPKGLYVCRVDKEVSGNYKVIIQ